MSTGRSDFLTLKCYHWFWRWSKQKITIFLTLCSENAHFTLESRVFSGWRQFSIEKGHFLTNVSKRWQFFVLINARANANIFRVQKNTHFLKMRFFKHSVAYNEYSFTWIIKHLNPVCILLLLWKSFKWQFLKKGEIKERSKLL